MLGHLCWYDVLDSDKVSASVFNETMEANNVSVRKMNPPKISDLFRRACNYASLRNVAGPKGPVSFICQKRGYDSLKVYYDVMLTENNKTSKIGSVSLSREDGEVSLDTEHRVPYIEYLHFKILWFMETYQDILPTIQVRESLRLNLENECGGIRMKDSGGIYFIPQPYEKTFHDTLNAFKTFDRCYISSVPVLNSPDYGQQELIRTRFFDTTLSELETIKTETVGCGSQEMRIINKRLRKLEDLQTSVDNINTLIGETMHTYLCNEISEVTKLVEGVG